MFLEAFNSDSRELQRYLKKKFKGCFKGVSRQFQRLLGKFQGNVEKVSSVFQENFNKVLFCNFVLAWISSQLPEQKEGLFVTWQSLQLTGQIECLFIWMVHFLVNVSARYFMQRMPCIKVFKVHILPRESPFLTSNLYPL